MDQVYAEPILDAFTERSGIEVKAVFDVEAAKTTGLVQRLIAERNRVRADVFWSGEMAQTMLLKEEECLAPYLSPSAKNIPSRLIDRDRCWTGFAGRARVLLVNTDLVPPERYPDSVEDLLDPSWPGDKVGIAYPLFGTTATHAAALYSVWGPERGRAFFEELARRKVKVLAGNSVVRDQVAAGELMFGLTDSDDAARAIEAGWPVRVIVPDQEDGGMGALLIPNTVGMVKGSPHPEPARALIDFLLSLEVECELAERGWTHFPVRSIGVPAADVPGLGPAIRELQVDYTKVYEQLPRAIRELRTILVAS